MQEVVIALGYDKRSDRRCTGGAGSPLLTLLDVMTEGIRETSPHGGRVYKKLGVTAGSLST